MKTIRKTKSARAAVPLSVLLSLLLSAAAPCFAQTGTPTGGGPSAEGGAPVGIEESAFVRDNKAAVSTFALSNGIPVYLKHNSANRVCNISLVLRGGSLVAVPDQAGWENLAFKTMARGSTEWPYARLSALLDETSASISSSTQFEYSTYSLNALDKYFDRLFPVWASTLMRPGFTGEDFAQARSEAELVLQQKEQDPWARTGQVMNQAFFEGHPYAIMPEGTTAALAASSPEALKTWLAEHFSADRIFIVAVGDFSAESLHASLESAFGTIPDLKLGPPSAAPAFAPAGKGRLFTEEFEQSKGVAYLRGDFAAPAPGAPDAMAANVAMKLYADLLFSVIRDKYGAVYTPGAYIRSFGANYGSVIIYKTSATGKIKSYIDEATGIMASGRCVSVDPGRPGDEAKYMKIGDALSAYKAMYANEYFDAVRTNAAVAGLMTRSVIQAGDPADWLGDAARIRAVTQEEVETAFGTYLLKGNLTWVALGDADILDPLVPGDFETMDK